MARGRGHAHAPGAAEDGALLTPDGRYIVVRGRLWRASNPALPADERQRHVDALMVARREVGVHQRGGDAIALRRARQKVHAAKVALGERGPVWWTDGTPDYSRRLARNTPYAAWYTAAAPTDAGRPGHPGRARAGGRGRNG